MKRKKQIAIRGKALVYSKAHEDVDLSEERFLELYQKAKENYSKSKAPFYEASKNSTRIVLIEKCQCEKEPCRSQFTLFSSIFQNFWKFTFLPLRHLQINFFQETMGGGSSFPMTRKR